MRHHVDAKKLGRTSAHRKAMLANMAASLILHNKIETTLPKAKMLRGLADRLVTMGKTKSLHARRRAISIIRDNKAVHKLFDELAGRFANRPGGYTRILKLGVRHGDCSPMAMIEYIPSEKKGEDGGEKIQKKSAVKKEKHAPKLEKSAAPKQPNKIEKKKMAPKVASSAKSVAKRSSPTHRSSKGE